MECAIFDVVQGGKEGEASNEPERLVERKSPKLRKKLLFTACFWTKWADKKCVECVNKPEKPSSHLYAALSSCIRGGRHYRQVG